MRLWANVIFVWRRASPGAGIASYDGGGEPPTTDADGCPEPGTGGTAPHAKKSGTLGGCGTVHIFT